MSRNNCHSLSVILSKIQDLAQQQYNNHIRYYTPHHFIFYPAWFALLCAGIYGSVYYEGQRLIFVLVTGGIFLSGRLSFMMRQHYALMNQNRIVRLELRLRYYQLTHTRLELYEDKLTFKQLAALRFASDEELPILLQRAISEGLSPDMIKKYIVNWQADDMRV